LQRYQRVATSAVYAGCTILTSSTQDCEQATFWIHRRRPSGAHSVDKLMTQRSCQRQQDQATQVPPVQARDTVVMQAATRPGVLFTAHGGSTLRVYASYGAWRLGRAGGSFEIARVFPSEFYSIHRTLSQSLHACVPIKQFVAAVFLATMLEHGPSAHCLQHTWLQKLKLASLLFANVCV